MAVRVGVLGLGMMGTTHIHAYRGIADAHVVAICDIDSTRLHGPLKAWSNVENREVTLDVADVGRHVEAREMIERQDIDVVDVCVPTELHVEYSVAGLQAGKHVIVEKPIARSTREVAALLDAARDASRSVFVGHCMRFWPGWDVLKEWFTAERFGRLLSATFHRSAAHPGGEFYGNAERSGGALLDLHIHDADFVQYCFGAPLAVTSFGADEIDGAVNHVVTHYHYENPAMIVAEGAWFAAPGFRFSMSYRVCFEEAVVTYNSDESRIVRVYSSDGTTHEEELAPQMGYDRELTYFVKCMQEGVRPQTVTIDDAVNAVRIIEAEKQSLESQLTVKL